MASIEQSQNVPTSEKAYFQSMSVYPSFLPFETQIAAEGHLQGMTLAQISQLTPFRQYQHIEGYALQDISLWKGAFTKLFSESQHTGQLISFGNVERIQSYGRRYQARYPGFEAEDFLQGAVFFLVPELLTSYDKGSGSFLSYMKGALIKDLESRVDILLHRQSMLPIGQRAERVPAKRQTNRIPLDSLFRQLKADEMESATVGERIVDAESSDPFDSIARVDVIHALYALAGVRADQAEAFTLLEINGEKQKPVAQGLGITDRALRTRRNAALAALQRLGKEQVQAILAGELDEVQTPA